MSTPDLTPVAQAIADAIDWDRGYLDDHERALLAGDIEAAVRPLIEAEVREQIAAERAKVAEFVVARAEFITAINNCHPDNAADYHRWQGHAEARRQLAEQLGLPVAWPAGYAGPRGGASDGSAVELHDGVFTAAGDLTEDVYEEIVARAETAGLSAPYHVHAPRSLLYTDDLVSHSGQGCQGGASDA